MQWTSSITRRDNLLPIEMDIILSKLDVKDAHFTCGYPQVLVRICAQIVTHL